MAGLPVPLFTLLVTLVAFAVCWALSLSRRDAGIVDLWWAPGFVLTALLTAAAGGTASAGWPVLLAVTLWGLRLGWHMVARHGLSGREDPRYAAMRAERGEAFARWSLPNVFLLQAVIQWLVAAPLHAALLPGGVPLAGPLGTAMLLAGAALFAGGLALEAWADASLAAFRADPANRGGLYTGGPFAFVRHPNHLGEIVLWWGIGLVAVALSGRWWALAGPALLTVLVWKVSGPPMLEPVLKGRKGYAAWAARTPALWPFRRKG
jgi:steroid 5-alpha reductase family enzyme